ncbi:MAG: hypothetical protein QXK37_06375 [Candidatus Woesearchaeota archaeon]
MESIEIVIFVGLAIIIGGFVTGMLVDWDYTKTFSLIKKMMIRSHNEGFETVDTAGYAGRLNKFFSDCTISGMDKVLVLHVKDNGTLDKKRLFSFYKDWGWCHTIQSNENGCGFREDVEMEEIVLPSVVRANCTNGKIYIS